MKKTNLHTRRHFLKYTSTVISSLALSPPVKVFGHQRFNTNTRLPLAALKELGLKSDPQLGNCITPISSEDLFSNDFNGDDISRPHDLLWNVEGYLKKRGGRPKASEFFDTLILGGGIAGLTCAYQLRKQNVLILDQAPQWGGNAKGEQFDQAFYSIGSAYINQPTVGSEFEKMLAELGLMNHFRVEDTSQTSVLMNGQLAHKFWSGTTDPNAALQFAAVYTELQRIYNQEYPEIPPTSVTQSKMIPTAMIELDSISFLNWLEKKFGSLHPHILEYFQLYAWSSFGGSIEELSAAQCLNFLAAETGDIVAFPGGNSAITQSLVQRLRAELKPTSMRQGSMVLDVRIENNYVSVTYEASDGMLHTVQGIRAIIALPKFVAKKIIPNLPTEQFKAMDSINYRSYILANIILDRAISSPCFDLYRLIGEIPPEPNAAHPSNRPFTDLCFGTWAQLDQPKNSVLTVYHPLPFDGARQFLFNSLSHEKYLNKIRQGLPPLLNQFGLSLENVKGIRMTRWGHSLPLAETGLIAQGTLIKASAPVDGKIFFANQDNWANPSVECAFSSAMDVINQIR